ncbi:hypothetical protein ETAA8_38420 [Anatilimnocola aggregata]|uniref:Uncharacterized protein n=1 Tax=Anatilimnocola aggregata TaxID=2528021 RepID=A0A517YET7_9BACT|nr:hypothetical protein [Anatilimnocola aggregata]QDU28737.1 hypothetical protein ETAA8_38420 [Anatilimnocola aggregata]
MTTEGEIIEIWPKCPECGASRQAECLVCGNATDFFPTAYQPDEQAEALRFCPDCDDVAQLRFYRRCHRCEYDFGDGYTPPLRVEEQEHESKLAWVLLLGLIAGLAVLMAYFSLLFRR